MWQDKGAGGKALLSTIFRIHKFVYSPMITIPWLPASPGKRGCNCRCTSTSLDDLHPQKTLQGSAGKCEHAQGCFTLWTFVCISLKRGC